MSATIICVVIGILLLLLVAWLMVEFFGAVRHSTERAIRAEQLLQAKGKNEADVEYCRRQAAEQEVYYKEQLEEQRIEIADQYQNLACLIEEKVKIKKEMFRHLDTLNAYSKMLQEERIEGFQQAHQIGDLKNENARLAVEITRLKARKVLPRKIRLSKMTKIFPSMTKTKVKGKR